jgi:hypothetical protein
MRKNLTYDYCASICSEFKTRSEISREHQTVYKKVIQSGWSELLPSRANTEHTRDSCMTNAAKCKTRGEFAKRYQGMYRTSRKNGWMDDFFPGSGIAKPQAWSLLSAVREAKKHLSSGDLMRSNRSAYNYLKDLHLVSRVFGNRSKDFWTPGVMRAHALLCENRSDFYRYYRSAYSAMNRLNCKEYVIADIPRGKADSDIFYAWQVISPSCMDVWKVGVASSKIKHKQRASDVSRSLGVSIGTYFQKSIGEKSALMLEREVLDRFDGFSGMSGDGSTELIIATPSDIENIFNKLGW